MVYLLTFLTSGILLLISYMYDDNKFLKYFLILLSIIVPSIVAGIRSYDIGTDVLVYGNYVFEDFLNSDSFIGLLKHYSKEIEPGYLLLNFIVTSFTKYPSVLYFFIEFIIMSFVVGYIRFFAKNRDDAFFMLIIYFFLFFDLSLNVLRQSLAIAITLYSIKYIKTKQPLKFVLFIILATSFHFSALLCLTLYPIYSLIKQSKNKTNIVAVIVVAFIAFRLMYIPLFSIVANIVPKYQKYLTNTDIFAFEIKPIIIRMPLIIACIYLLNHQLVERNKMYYILCILLIELVFTTFRAVSEPIYRFSYYFGLFKIPAYIEVYKILGKKYKLTVNFALIIVLTTLWVYRVVIQGNNHVYPYKTIFEDKPNLETNIVSIINNFVPAKFKEII